MKVFSLTTLFLLQVFYGLAQNNGSIRGSLIDTALRQPVGDATISVLDVKDSSLISFSRANKNGVFELKFLPVGNYRLLVTHVGYRNANKLFSIAEGKKEVDLGFLVMTNKSVMLDEVLVSQERAPVTIKNDTVEFNAGSFQVKPNAVVEDLLKKLPGVQVDKDGKIKANGEEVKKVLVDGKEFFGNDPKIASKNLPADVVDKVQVFDKKSDQSQFTGFDDGNSEKTINLTLKQDKKNGMFGRVVAGAGNKERYQGTFNLNSFKGQRQMSAIGMANNTNKLGFSFTDLFSFGGGLGGMGGGRGGGAIEVSGGGLPIQGMPGQNNGITTTWAGGLNFNDSWNQKLDINGSYFYNRLQDRIDQKSNREYQIPGNNFNRLQDAIVGRKNENHRLNFTGDYKVDSFNSLKLVTSANIQQTVSNSWSTYRSLAQSSKLLNSGIAQSQNSSNGFNWNSSLLWRHRFKKKGRTFSANLTAGINDAQTEGLLSSVNGFFKPDGSLGNSDTLNQSSQQSNSGNSYGATLSYTEPLSKKSLLEFTYAYSGNSLLADKRTFDVFANGKDSILNETLTNQFDNTYTYHRGGGNWRYQGAKMNFTIGANVQQAILQSRYTFLGRDSSMEQSFTNLLPVARMEYSINRYKNLRLSYNTNTRQPNAQQLNPIPDNTDPLNIRLGNAELGQEYNHRLQFNYMAFDPFRNTSFFTMVNFTNRENAIVNSDMINEQGVRLTMPVNAKGTYNLDANISWGFPIKAIKSNLNINSSASKSNNVNYLNGQKNKINNWNIAEEISLNFVNKKTLDITLLSRISYNSVRYSLGRQQNINYWNQEYGLDANIYLPLGFSLASEFSFTKNTGYADGFNTNIALWNAGIVKQLFKNKRGEVKLQVFDILNENAGISRNANQNYVEDVYSRVLNRYFLVSFTYNISRFAGKAVPVQPGHNIKVIGVNQRM